MCRKLLLSKQHDNIAKIFHDTIARSKLRGRRSEVGAAAPASLHQLANSRRSQLATSKTTVALVPPTIIIII